MIETGIPSHLTAQQQVEHLIDSGLLYVWESESGGIVSMAAKVYGDTPNGQRISLVYTAPKSRGKGYASSVVAFLSQNILESNKKFCFLFTDLKNPTSNKIYQLIGYKSICDFNQYHFD